jgi:hypothetical protein
VGINNLGQISYHNDITGASAASTVVVDKGIWQTLQVHLRIADTASQIEVWYNDALVGALSRTDSLGTNPIGRLQLGENTGGLTYDIAFDDVVAAISLIASDPISTYTPTPILTATSTQTATPTSTLAVTSTSTPTGTSTQTATPTSTLAITSTSTATSTRTATPTRTPTPSPTRTNTPLVTSTFTPTSTPTIIQGSTITLTPSADAYVNSASPNTNYGSVTTLRADGSPLVSSYLRFTVPSLNGATVTRARLLIFANSSASQGLAARAVADNTWLQGTLNYNNAPPMGIVLASMAPATGGTWITFDVTAYVTGAGTFNFGVITPGSTAISLSSRESGANAPKLILDLQ